MPYWLAVFGFVCAVIGAVLPLPLVLIGKARWWTWAGLVCGVTGAGLLAPTVLGWWL